MKENNIEYEKYGRVVCAALLHDDCIYSSYLGHYAIFPMEQIGVLRNAKQGFLTENGFFVDRILGLEIAKYYDQIDYKYPPLSSLNSEDLRKDNLQVLKRVKKYSYKHND